EAGPADLNQAIERLLNSFESWSRTEVDYRACILEKVAKLMIERRFELTAVIILETGKGWLEADADLGEAVDFLLYYAREARELFSVRKMGSLQGEHNIYFYEPRGL